MKNTIDRLLDRAAEVTDQIFDIPVEATNQIFDIQDDVESPQNRRYEKYRNGMHKAEAGAVLAVGGLAAAGAGVEAGGVIMLTGYGMFYWGGVKALWNAVQID